MKDVIVKNKSLLQPILTALKLKWNRISVVENSYDKENWKITLDIDWKNVILGADMKFWYFAQCVNHMLLIDNISAEIPWEWAYVDFKSSVVRNGRVDETKAIELPWKTKMWVDFSFLVHKDKPEEPKEPEKKPEYQDWSDPSNGKTDKTIEEKSFDIDKYTIDSYNASMSGNYDEV